MPGETKSGQAQRSGCFMDDPFVSLRHNRL